MNKKYDNKKLQNAIEYANETDSQGKRTAKPDSSKKDKGKMS